MGVGVLMKLLREAKSTNDIITLEATVITGFERLALDECREVCKSSNLFAAKGRIFFNIKKDTYPNVLKMRSIDNVFLVSSAFPDLNLKNVQEADLEVIKNLAEKVDWDKSVPEWAKIVDFKGVQFPKCASGNEAVDESEPVCQSCKTAKGFGDGPQATNRAPVNPSNPVISNEEICQSLSECCLKIEDEDFQKEDSIGNQDKPQDGVALGSSPDASMLTVKQEDTDDEAFLSAEESLPNPEDDLPNTADYLPNLAALLPIELDELYAKSTGEDLISFFPLSGAISEAKESGSTAESRKQARFEKEKAKWQRSKDKKREKSRNAHQSTEPKSGDHQEEPKDRNGPNGEGRKDLNEPKGDAHPAGGPEAPTHDKKKNYWQRRREAKEKKAAEARDKKPPRKAYIDDGIMKFRVTCYRNGPKHSFESNDAAGHFGGLINDKFHWTVDLTRFDINVVLVIEGDSAYVSLALTSKSLHRRNITNFGPTTLRATLCYSLVRFAEPSPGDVIMDPMCGGGSISIEGALAFPGTFHICGDVNEKCVQKIADNVAYNSAEKPLMVDGFQWSVRRLPLRDQCVDILVTDLPFGLRVGKKKDNTGLYTVALSEIARVVRPCGRASLLTYDKTAMIRAMQRTSSLWRQIHCNMVNQGGLRCFAYLLLRKSPLDPPAPQGCQLAEDAQRETSPTVSSQDVVNAVKEIPSDSSDDQHDADKQTEATKCA